MRFRKTILCLSALAGMSSLTGVIPAEAHSPRVASATSGASQTCIVLYRAQSVSSDAATVISKAGGTVVSSYSQIGVVIATSSNASFQSKVTVRSTR